MAVGTRSRLSSRVMAATVVCPLPRISQNPDADGVCRLAGFAGGCVGLVLMADGQKPAILLRCGLTWLRGQDLNLRPSGYEPDELPGCSTPRYFCVCERVCLFISIVRRADLAATYSPTS